MLLSAVYAHIVRRSRRARQQQQHHREYTTLTSITGLRNGIMDRRVGARRVVGLAVAVAVAAAAEF